MRKSLSGALAGALLLAVLAGCSDSAAGGGQAVSVEAVSSIVNGGAVGLLDRYAGMVVSGETADVKRDSNKTVLEIYVKEGDTVRAGEPLFCYDSEKMQLDLDRLYLKREDFANTISAAEAEISELESQRSKAKDSEKLSYTLQIDSRKADIREAQYNNSLNERDIASMEAALENTEITSPIAGRVMSVDEEGSSDSYGYYDDEQSGGDTGVKFITVTDVTSLRIQGNISEMNAYALTEGMEMLIRSRLDNTVTWRGVLSSIDWDNPVENDNSDGMVYISSSEDDEMTTASKYPFYIELESTEGLLLGQHVYIEPDTGEEEEPAGPMLPSYYLVMEGEDAYVWADDGKDKLEKRAVELGQYDEDMDCYEIADGLDMSDYIAFPEEGLTEGQATEKYDPSAQAEEMADEGPAPVGEAVAMP